MGGRNVGTGAATSFYERKIPEIHVEEGLQAVERSQSNAGPAYECLSTDNRGANGNPFLRAILYVIIIFNNAYNLKFV